jgi:hypothetical protein
VLPILVLGGLVSGGHSAVVGYPQRLWLHLSAPRSKVGDVLVCDQPRRRRTFKVTVTADGWIALSAPQEGEYDKPSPALVACTGGQINGWGN